jgi:outer membrane lipoprotein SlyB
MQTIRFMLGSFAGACLMAAPVHAHDDRSSNVEAAIGGGLGGAVGAVIGNEVGGRTGAVIGGGLGGAGGAAVFTRDDDHHRDGRYYDSGHGYRGRGGFCPPGQAKKGRC